MKSIILTIGLIVLTAISAGAQQNDANACGAEFRRWSANANSIKSGMYAQIGAMSLSEVHGVPQHMIDGYMQNCRLAAGSVILGGCYDFVAKKVVFPSTVEKACEAVVQKIRTFEAAFKADRQIPVEQKEEVGQSVLPMPSLKEATMELEALVKYVNQEPFRQDLTIKSIRVGRFHSKTVEFLDTQGKCTAATYRVKFQNGLDQQATVTSLRTGASCLSEN